VGDGKDGIAFRFRNVLQINFLMLTFIAGCYKISWNGNCECNRLDNIIYWGKLCYVK
jgi:hypothetical protein